MKMKKAEGHGEAKAANPCTAPLALRLNWFRG